MKAEELRQAAIPRFEELAHYLYPRGHRDGHCWCVGSANGEPGRSCKINLRTPILGDFAAGERMKSGAIDLWMMARNCDFFTAAQELETWLGLPPSYGYQNPQNRQSYREEHPTPKVLLPLLETPTDSDINSLSVTRSIQPVALQIAARRGLLFCFDCERNGRCWVFTDSTRRCAIRRRIDGKPFILADGRTTKAAACPGSNMTVPIGIQEAIPYPAIGIVEGGPNALAVIGQAWGSGLENRVAPICMPSAGANFSYTDAGYLRNKRCRIFADNDRPGWDAMMRWAAQLAQYSPEVDGYSFSDLETISGNPVNDLNDLCQLDAESWECHRDGVEAIMNFALQGGG